jgi:arginine:pyruvate transaminase
MKISHRLSNITGGGSDGWEVFYRARALKAAGHKITELTIGDHDILTAPAILDAMYAAARAGHTGYAIVPGIPDLRAAVAQRIAARTGVPTTAANILITAGGQAGLFAAHHAALDEGDTALIIDPYYATYPGVIRALGAKPVMVAAKPEDSFQPQAAAIAAKAAGAKSLLINSPNNPTGVIYSRATLMAIGQVCIDHDLWLISDEVYDTQVWDGEHISPRALPGMAERTMVVGSMSKSHAMTGSRIGWVCAPEAVIENLINLATHNTYGVVGYIQDAALFALAQGTALEQEVAAPFARRRQITLDVLRGQNVVKYAPIQGAMFAMLDIRATGLGGDAFANALLDAERIAVMPGESFGAAAAGHVRVAMTISDDAYAAALTRLVAFAQDQVNAA